MSELMEIILTSLCVGAFVGLAAGLIAFFKAKSTMFTVGESWSARGYSVYGSAKLWNSQDIFLRSHTRVEQKPNQNNNKEK